MEKEYNDCKVRPARPDDGPRLYHDIRIDDIAEIIGLGEHPRIAIEESLKKAERAYTVTDKEGGVLAIFGVCPTETSGVGCGWMLGTTRLGTISWTFRRHCRDWLPTVMGDYRCLINLVSTSNTLSIRWLKWMGAEWLRADRIPGYLEFMIPKQP